jgi:hypothetical protein
MPESIERLVRGFSVLRLLSIVTLLLIVACLIISASIALADASRVFDTTSTGASDTTAIDVYEFDFSVKPETSPNPEFDEFVTSQDI